MRLFVLLIAVLVGAGGAFVSAVTLQSHAALRVAAEDHGFLGTCQPWTLRVVYGYTQAFPRFPHAFPAFYHSIVLFILYACVHHACYSL